MAIVIEHSLSLSALRFVHAARIRVWKGEACLRSGGVTVLLKAGESFAVPAFIRFSCHTHNTGQTVMWSLALECGSEAMQAINDGSKPWSRDLAQMIFADPAAPWTAAQVAQRWQITIPKMRARLFAEGESLRSLLREQRVSHAFYRLARIDADVSGILPSLRHEASGFTSGEALAHACLDVIGMPPEILQRSIALWSATQHAPAQKNERQVPRYRRYF